jgi:hypothetical protein
MKSTAQLVREQVAEILKSKQFNNWFSNLKPTKEGHVVFNNSYLFRENIKTTKSENYLAVQFDPQKGSMDVEGLYVVDGISINTDFQYFVKGSSNVGKEILLDNAIRKFVRKFGKVGFVLIGTIVDDVVLRASVGESGIDELILDPTQKDDVRIDATKIVIKELFDDETLWLKLQEKVNPLSESLAAPIAKALNNLRETAYVRLKIPADVSEVSRTMLDEIVEAFESAITEYKSSLDKCKGYSGTNPEEFNNVLRIAYNFAGDAMDLLRLIVQISDLKPVVLYSTIHTQLSLSNAFKELPWPRTEKKGSLKLYDKTVKGARNRAFHRLFPFSKAIDVDVSGLSFRAKKLRLFPEYGAHKSNTLDYEDRELVEIMTQFTRTTEHTVTPVFWQKNLAVMENTVALLKQLKTALISILSDQKAAAP